ncbi:MAG: aspartyl/asparaginyl beta-hydroxylase domain-containing protein [Agarilytica sp.]
MHTDSYQRFPNSCLVSEVFDEQDIGQITHTLSDEVDWQIHVNKKAYQGAWDVLPLRCMQQHQAAHPLLQSFFLEESTEPETWTNLPRITQYPSIAKLLSEFQCIVKSVRFMRLHPGSNILPHTDNGVGLDFGEARLHVPLVTDTKVCFFIAGNSIPMNTGELWYIDADKEHWVTNRSPNTRIHLVIDCVANAWLQDYISPTPR